MKNTKKEVLRNCIPAMVCMVISGLNTIIDGLFIGRNIGEDGLAAINIAWPVPAFIIASGIGIGVGCGINYVSALGKKHETLVKLVEGIGYKEGLPVVVNPGILDPKEFIDTVLNVRVPNPFMPDTPQRIATDTSQKLAIRFGETIKAYAASPELNVSDIKLIPLVFAGWLRYLMAIDDNGNEFTLSPDPMLDEVRPYVADIKLGDSFDADAKLKDILSNAKIFGVNLYEAGLAELTCQYFTEMTRKPGAVMETLQKYVG